ncbi:MAG: Na+/H+ antiporter NhaA [Phycisphaerales bacterium]|nr:Na+/H+ antiporter NhaA [Phycisphaerales bacterium]
MAHIPQLRPDVPGRPIDVLMSPIHGFLRVEAAAGVLLLVCTMFAVVWANSPWSESYHHFWHTDVSVEFGDHALTLSLAHFVNDALMAVFFFVVGLEIKRELLVGELASPRKAMLSIVAALGAMAAPALIFVLCNTGTENVRGWAIPTATDIAFAVGVMAMLGRRIPLSLKVFLTALAIVDDIAAVIVIALFYTSEISMFSFLVANGFLVASIIANRLGVRTPICYAVIGVLMWVFLLQSGVHATIGGVLMALTIPASMRINGEAFTIFARRAIKEFEDAGGDRDNIMTNERRQGAVRGLQVACEYVQTPLNRLEHGIHPWVAYLIMPVFALANAGVTIGDGAVGAITSGAGLGIVLGLVVGKPLGLILTVWLAVKSGLCKLPEGAAWRHIVGTGFLAGIGFTMSLFIANLAFRDHDTLDAAKMGILAGSLVSGVTGFLLLRAGGGAVRDDAHA